jgi:hypothetical protein
MASLIERLMTIRRRTKSSIFAATSLSRVIAARLTELYLPRVSACSRPRIAPIGRHVMPMRKFALVAEQPADRLRDLFRRVTEQDPSVSTRPDTSRR